MLPLSIILKVTWSTFISWTSFSIHLRVGRKLNTMSRLGMSSETSRPKKKIVTRAIAPMLALIVCAALYDLSYPRTTLMREFDPDEVARLETARWRSYYEKHRLSLFTQLAELLAAYNPGLASCA